MTLEDGIIKGGFGESVRAYYSSSGRKVSVEILGYPDKFQYYSSEERILSDAGLTEDGIASAIGKYKV